MSSKLCFVPFPFPGPVLLVPNEGYDLVLRRKEGDEAGEGLTRRHRDTEEEREKEGYGRRS